MTIPAPAKPATTTYTPRDNKPVSKRGTTREPAAALEDEDEEELLEELLLPELPETAVAVATDVTVPVPEVPAWLRRAEHDDAGDAD